MSEKCAAAVIRPPAAPVDPPMTLEDASAGRFDGGTDRDLRADAGLVQIGPTSETIRMSSPSRPDTTASAMTEALIAVRDRRDRAAFGRLFDYFGPRLKGMLMRGGLRDGSAEDVVQDVMLAVWHKASQFDPHRAEASAWIYRIARNRQIDLARRRPPPAPDVIEEQEGTEPDAAQLLALAQEAQRLREAIGRLSPEQGRVLQQAYVEDLPQSRISELTGIPLGTVKSRIRLGLERLRHELRDLKP